MRINEMPQLPENPSVVDLLFYQTAQNLQKQMPYVATLYPEAGDYVRRIAPLFDGLRARREASSKYNMVEADLGFPAPRPNCPTEAIAMAFQVHMINAGYSYPVVKQLDNGAGLRVFWRKESM